MTMPGPRLPTAGEPLPTAGSPHPRRAAAPAPGPDDAARRGPVVVLTYAHAGGARLQALLADRLGFACTSGTGILPLCQQAAAAWRHAEDRPADAVLTPLAANSIRTLVTMMVTTIAARTGRRRWCEITTVQHQAAQTFLALYPQTRFICLHRACDGVIGAALAARPWGLSGPTSHALHRGLPGEYVAALRRLLGGAARTAARLRSGISRGVPAGLLRGLGRRPERHHRCPRGVPRTQWTAGRGGPGGPGRGDHGRRHR